MPRNPKPDLPVDDEPNALDEGQEASQPEEAAQDEGARTALKIPKSTSFEDRLALLKVQARSSRANPQLATVEGKTLHLIGASVTAMRGSMYGERDKCTFICEDGRAFDAQGDAALTSAHVLIDVLGIPPWPQPVAVVVEATETKRGMRHFVSPV